MSRQLNVLNITDTLEAGGLERMAVNLVNHLPRERCRAFLCTTRGDGPLLEKLAPHVIRLQLRRRHRFDVLAVRSLVSFIRKHDIQILHAHGSSLFVAIVASLFAPFPAVIRHVHSGGLATGEHCHWLHRIVATRIKGVIAVNQALADWTCRTLGMDSKRVWYLPNFVWTSDSVHPKDKMILPGEEGYRIVCLANIRPPKDHSTLLSAMAMVLQNVPNAHLILVGMASKDAYLASLQRVIVNYQMQRHVSFLGHRNDVLGILRSCDIGVLSSISEGFPMTLLEYGMAKLPTVATQVGQCPEVLDNGRAGILVSPGSPAQLAEAMVALLRSPERRQYLGEQLNLHVQEAFSQQRILEKFCQFYEMIVDGLEDAVATSSGR